MRPFPHGVTGTQEQRWGRWREEGRDRYAPSQPAQRRKLSLSVPGPGRVPRSLCHTSPSPGGRNFLKGFCTEMGQRKEEKALGGPLTADVHVQLMHISVAIYLSLHHPAAGATDPRWINIATGRSMRHPLPLNPPTPATSIRPLFPTTCWLGTLSRSIGFRFSLAVEAQLCSKSGRPPHPFGSSSLRLGMEPEAAIGREGPFGEPSPPGQ